MSRPLLLVAALLTAAYIACSALVIAHAGGHMVLELLLVQYAFLLPALVCYLRSRRADQGPSSPRAACPVTVYYLVYALVIGFFALSVLHGSKGLQFGDELAYRFESRVFLKGRLAADAPPTVSADANDFYFDHFLIHQNEWTGMYPPGWPAILTAGSVLHQGWLLNPLFGLWILWMAYELGILIFDQEVANLAVLLMVLSPSFLVNSGGFMSHPLDGALLATASLFLFRGLGCGRIRNFFAMLALVACSALVRPWTAFCVGAVLAGCALWSLRRQRQKLLSVVLAGGLVGASALAVLLTYNHALTGSYWRSTYALANTQGLREPVSFNPISIVKTAFGVTRQSLEQTALYAFPFLLLLAGFGLFAEKERRRDVRILGALFAVLVIGYTIEPLSSFSTVGERYYYESFFALAILGARGWTLLRARWSVSGARVAAVAILAVCAFHYALGFHAVRMRVAPHVRIMDAIARLPLRDAVVYVEGEPASHFNENAADWRHAPVFYMMDPGPARRAVLARALDRNEWVVVDYNLLTRSAYVEQFHTQLGRVERGPSPR